MAEASIVAFAATAGVLVALAFVCVTLRGKGHAEGSHNHDYDKVTTDDSHVHVDI